MPMWEISFVILSVVFLLLIVYSIPLFRQMWLAAKNMATLLDSLNQYLPSILKNIEEITTNINSTTYMLNKEVEGISALSRKIRNFLAFTENAERIFQGGAKLPLLATLKTARGFFKGLRVFFHVLRAKKPDRG
jgi:predicted PurR-regulated permease PerM